MIDVSEAIEAEAHLAIRPVFRGITGSLVAGLLLGWIWDTATEMDDLGADVPVSIGAIQNVIHLSVAELQTARRKLEHRKLIKERIINEVLHFQLITEEIELAVARFLQKNAKQKPAEGES